MKFLPRNVAQIGLRLAYQALLLWWRIARPITCGVRVLLFNQGQVLLVRHSYQDQWFMPGGGAKRGESLEQAARREAAEETGAHLGELHLLGIYTNLAEYKTDHIALFACQDFEWTGQGDAEIADAGVFSIDSLPPKLAVTHRQRILAYANGQKLPSFGRWEVYN